MSSKKEVAMKENGKSIWRARALLSNEKRGGLEAGETSFRVYYGQNGAAVPFMWESQPGTPKHPLSSHSNEHHIDLPPLTPPPQFHSSSSSSSTSFGKTRRSRIFSTFISSLVKKSRSHVIPSPILSSSPYSDAHSRSTSSSSSESVSFCSSKNKYRFHRRSVSACSTPIAKKFPLFYDDDHEDDDEEMDGSPNNTSQIICFGFKKQGSYSTKGI